MIYEKSRIWGLIYGGLGGFLLISLPFSCASVPHLGQGQFIVSIESLLVPAIISAVVVGVFYLFNGKYHAGHSLFTIMVLLILLFTVPVGFSERSAILILISFILILTQIGVIIGCSMIGQIKLLKYGYLAVTIFCIFRLYQLRYVRFADGDNNGSWYLMLLMAFCYLGAIIGAIVGGAVGLRVISLSQNQETRKSNN